MAERCLSVGEVSAHLGVSPDRTDKWLKHKKMPAFKMGRLWKLLASEADVWVKKGD